MVSKRSVPFGCASDRSGVRWPGGSTSTTRWPGHMPRNHRTSTSRSVRLAIFSNFRELPGQRSLP